MAPEFQRRGVGSMLVREAQRLARRDGVPVVLESSEAGQAMYARNGFERVWEGELCGVVDVRMVWWPEGVGKEGR